MTALERIPRDWLPVLLLSVVCGAGCQGPVYRAETVLLSSGRINRAIFQPRNETPAEVRESGDWRRVTASAERPPKRWATAIADLPDKPADDQHPYLVAVGTFSDADKVPMHFIAKAPDGVPDGRLTCEVSRTDYLFVVELHWLETLTDSVSLPDIPNACAELADFGGEVLTRLLEREVGADYDVTSVREWARSDGRTWITSIALALYEAGLRKQMHDDARLEQRMGAVCAQAGLRLTDDSGQPLDEKRRSQAIEDFLRRWMKDHCHPRGAGDPDKIDALVNALLEKRPSADDERAAALESRIKREVEEIAIEICGSKEALATRLWQLKTRIAGLYAPRLFNSQRRFHYSLKVPGRILSTNGERVSAGEVEWSFEDVDAFPLGYRMECRTLVADVDMQKRILGGRPLLTLESQREFIRLVTTDTELLSAVRACRQSNDLTPLERYRDSHDADSAEGKNFAALWALLNGGVEKTEETAR